MHQGNFKSIHRVRRSRRELKYLEKGEISERIEDTGSWGVESTQELQDSTEEPQNRHQEILGPLDGLFLRLGKK
jgi:hypothetical protein